MKVFRLAALLLTASATLPAQPLNVGEYAQGKIGRMIATAASCASFPGGFIPFSGVYYTTCGSPLFRRRVNDLQ